MFGTMFTVLITVKIKKSDNAQTYDYDDFVKIADSSVNADNIYLSF